MKAFIRQFIFITIILFLGTAAFAKSTPAPIPPQTYAPLNLHNTSELSQKIEQYIKEREAGLASVAVAVFSGKDTVYENYFGYADIDKNLVANKETVYEWGSASKIMVWVSVMQLWEQGKLDLNHDIKEYLPADFVKRLKFKKPVTMTHLMNHTAGFQECMYENNWAKESDIKPFAQTLLAFEPFQVYEPGETTAYSNWGNALAAYVVECISGMDYTDYLHKNILEPLGMTHTAVAATHNDNLWAKNKREELQCYEINSEGRKDLGTRVAYVELYPAGAVISTLEDFLTFAKAVANNDGTSPLFKNPDTAKLFHSASSYYSDSAYSKCCHGLWTTYYGTKLIGHAGNTFGCTANLLFDPETMDGIVVMANECGETAFNYGLAELVFGSPSTKVSISEDYVSPDISGFYTSSRTFIKGPFKMSTYMYFMPIFRSKTKGDTNNYRLPYGGKFQYLGNKCYLMDNGNGMSVMMYLNHNSKGRPILEMETTDYIREPLFVPVFTMIIFMFLLAIACVVILIVKGLKLVITRKRVFTRQSILTNIQLVVPPIITIMIYFLMLSDHTRMIKPFGIVSAVLAGIVCLFCAANGVYLITKKRWFGAVIGMFSSFFIGFFQLCNFWSF